MTHNSRRQGFLYHGGARATCQRASQARKQLRPFFLFTTTFAPEEKISLEIISDVTKGWVSASWLPRFHASLTRIRSNKRKQLLLQTEGLNNYSAF